MPAKAHRPFVGGNKNDVHDARAIWRAVQRPDVKALAVKTEEQQGRRGLQRMRGQWVKLRTARINGLRGLLTENGELMLQGKAGIRGGIGEAVQRLSDRVLAMVIDPLGEQWARIGPLDDQIGEIERRVKGWHKEDQACQRIADIPGVGLPSARAALATMGDAKALRCGREFAACLGWVPRQSGTAGRMGLLGMRKRGDTYLRTLLIHGARWVLRISKEPPEWATNLAQRRAQNVAIAALANKMARTIWALLAHERAYQKGFVSQAV